MPVPYNWYHRLFYQTAHCHSTLDILGILNQISIATPLVNRPAIRISRAIIFGYFAVGHDRLRSGGKPRNSASSRRVNSTKPCWVLLGGGRRVGAITRIGLRRSCRFRDRLLGFAIFLG